MSAPPGAAPPGDGQRAALRADIAALRRQNRLAETLPLLEAALRAAPGDADLHNELGLTLIHMNQASRALACFDAALRHAPRHAPALLNRGKLLEQLNRPGFAACYRQAVEADPALHEAQARLAATLETAGQRDAARQHYAAAAALVPPDSPQGQLYRTRLALLSPSLAESEAGLRDILAADPHAHAARAMLGKILAARGHFAAAETELTAALAGNPGDIALWFDVVRTRRLGPADAPLIARMQAARAVAAPVPARLRLLLALAKAQDDCGDFAAAAATLAEAGTLRARHFPLDRAALTALTDRQIGLFTPGFLARPGRVRVPDALPILIIGLPRSGTTLTERMLARHPRIVGAGELNFWENTGPGLLAALRPDAPADTAAPAAAYLARLRREAAPETRHVIDKNPFNYRWALLAHLALPNARIIHCRRDPADTALSIMLAALQPHKLFSSAPDDLRFAMQEYGRLMAHARAVLPADRFLELRYEDLVAAPEAQLRRVLAFCGLDFAPACLAPEADARAVLTASLWQARQPINTGSIGRARNYAALLAPFGAPAA